MNFYWQNIPEYIDPIAFMVGFLSVRWYALCFLIGILAVFGTLRWRERRDRMVLRDSLPDLLFLVFIGAIVGGRLGYVFFYDFPYFLGHPWAVISPYDFDRGIWTGIRGLSFHGGLIGAALSMLFFVRSRRMDFWSVADRLAFVAPVAIFFGRAGNFVNGELYGRVTDKPWGMYFPSSETPLLLRHPSQFYEAVAEGVLLFALLWYYEKKKGKTGFPGGLTAVFLMGYAAARFLSEFFREPDPQIGFILCGLTMGQWLSSVMFLSGMLLFGWLKRKKHATL